jgi:WD40 repeat protein/tetratricopeptide (TPR) repeat protein
VAFSLDGRRLATGSDDKTVKLWDVESGREVQTLTGPTGEVTCVTFSPDGRLLASGGRDHSGVKLWDAGTGRYFRALYGNIGWVSSVAFSPDGARLAAGDWRGAVKVWNVQNGQDFLALGALLPTHGPQVHTVAFSPDGQRLAAGLQDKTVSVWEVRTGREVLTLRRHTNAVNSVAFSPDGMKLASGSLDGTIELWDALTGEHLLTLRGHTSGVSSIAFSPDAQRLVSGSADRTVKLWDVRSGQDAIVLRGHTTEVTSVAFSPDGRRLASGSQDGTVRLWDTSSGQQLLSLPGGNVYCVAFSPDGQRLASGNLGGMVTLWDVASGQEIRTLRGHSLTVTSLAFSRDGERLASGAGDHTVRVWDTRDGRELLALPGHTNPGTCVAFSPDGRWLASGIQRYHAVRLCDSRTGKEICMLRGHSATVENVAFSPDGQVLASGSADNTIKLWDVRRGQELLTLRGHTGQVTSLSFSPVGRRLASASLVNTVRLWDTRSGMEILALRAQTRFLSSVTFSPDGERLAFPGADSTVTICDARPGPEVRTIRDSTTGVMDLGFSPDGRWLFGRGFGVPERAWDVGSGKSVPPPAVPGVVFTRGTARHLSRSLLAVALPGRIELVDVGTPGPAEQGSREAMARFDTEWHLQQAANQGEEQDWFASTFHTEQVTRFAPSRSQGELWEWLERACAHLPDARLALGPFDRRLQQEPTLAPLYFRRARLHAQWFAFAEATADNIAGLALAGRNPMGWPSHAVAAGNAGYDAAKAGNWSGACRAFADAARWEPQLSDHLYWLACAQLAAGREQDFRATCRRLFERYRTTDDVEPSIRLSVALTLDLSPAPSLVRGLHSPVADALLRSVKAKRVADIVYTACLVPKPAVPARDLVHLAAEGAQMERSGESVLILGIARYRAGQYAEALTTLREAAKLQGEDLPNSTRLFLAMAYQRQQQPLKARAWFDRAKLPAGADWNRRLIYHRLHAEADALLKPGREPQP